MISDAFWSSQFQRNPAAVGASIIAIGIVAGVIAVLATSRLVANLLYGIRPNDAGNLVLAVAAFLLVAATAAYLPAWRASRLDPLLALREE